MFPDYLTESYKTPITFLTKAIKENKLANSYIFIGKDVKDILSVVVTIAKILNCEKNKNLTLPPCESCINCRWLEKNEHPQALITISPDSKSKKEQVKIETIRELLNTLNLSSNFFRIVFFQNPNLNFLPQEASNLLLKVVEETPERTIFIFASSTKDDILPTIISRCQAIYFNKKLTSISNGDFKTKEEIFSNYFPNNITSSLEKAKMTLEYVEDEGINLEEFLTCLLVQNYNLNKYSNHKQFCHLHKNITTAFLKLKSFMQPKIVLEDLLLSLTN